MPVATMRRRETIVAFSILTGLLILFTILKGPPIPHDTLKSLSSYVPSRLLPASLSKAAKMETLEVLAQLYEDERLASLTKFDRQAAEEIVRTPPGALDPNFDNYVKRLETFIDTYFNHSSFHAPLTNTITRMVNARPPVAEGRLRKRVFSYEKDGRDAVPPEFNYWDKRLGEFGWSIEVGDDDKMEEWFSDIIAVDEHSRFDEDERAFTGQARWEEMWRGIGVPVLKSDLLRYLMLLTQGGMYTDSDTSVLSDPMLWGTHAHDMTPRGLAAIQRAMRHLDPDHPSYNHLDALRSGSPIVPSPYFDDESETGATGPRGKPTGDPAQVGSLMAAEEEEETATPLVDIQATSVQGGRNHAELDLASNPFSDVKKGINNPRVALVVAVEYDTHHERQDPRFGYTRDLQIVQWTMLAKPFHPVYLDVLDVAIDKIMENRRSGDGKETWHTVLDGTGPGPFTDAVLRYLLVQYGVEPQTLFGMEDGALIGDVLVLPLHAFGSFLGGEEDWNAHDPSTRCTSHGFRGRWKGSLSEGFDRRRRLRRIPRLA